MTAATIELLDRIKNEVHFHMHGDHRLYAESLIRELEKLLEEDDEQSMVD